jgi:sulfide:quinone oxidoreductase
VSTGSPDVIVAGAGTAALESALALRALGPRATRIRMVAERPDHYEPGPLMIADVFAGRRPRRYPLAAVAARGIGLIPGSLASVSTDERVVVTWTGARMKYDALIVATGAEAVDVLPAAVTLTGPADAGALQALVRDIDRGRCGRAAFVVPRGASWTLPVYELALHTAQRARAAGSRCEVLVVTPELRPLAAFGPGAWPAVERLLEEAGVRLVCGADPGVPAPRLLALGDGRTLEADWIAALPRRRGRAVPGLPSDQAGFIPVDAHGRVRGVRDVYAVGDAAAHPLKQGGLATQQADVAVAALLRDAGLAPDGPPYHPVLHGLLLGGPHPLYLRRSGTGEHVGEASVAPLGPRGKVAGRFIEPFLEELDALGVAAA